MAYQAPAATGWLTPHRWQIAIFMAMRYEQYTMQISGGKYGIYHWRGTMFELEGFIEDCKAIQAGGDDQAAIHELVSRAISDPAALMKELGEPTQAGIQTLYQADNLTILNLTWGPYMTLKPHNHSMWAVIGIYTGREDNIFWRRDKDNPSQIEAAGAKNIGTGDCAQLGRDIIHSVTNPVPRITGALHVYGGDFFNEPRSQWDPDALLEEPFNVEDSRALFALSNKML